MPRSWSFSNSPVAGVLAVLFVLSTAVWTLQAITSGSALSWVDVGINALLATLWSIAVLRQRRRRRAAVQDR